MNWEELTFNILGVTTVGVVLGTAHLTGHMNTEGNKLKEQYLTSSAKFCTQIARDHSIREHREEYALAFAQKNGLNYVCSSDFEKDLIEINGWNVLAQFNKCFTDSKENKEEISSSKSLLSLKSQSPEQYSF